MCESRCYANTCRLCNFTHNNKTTKRIFPKGNSDEIVEGKYECCIKAAYTEIS